MEGVPFSTIKSLVGEEVTVKFESKRFDGIYELKGKLVSATEYALMFENFTTNYPPGIPEEHVLNTRRVRSIHK